MSSLLIYTLYCKFRFVTGFNKHIEGKHTEAHSGLCSADVKQKALLSRIKCLPSSHQNITPVWAFSISTLAVLQTILSTMLVAWKNRQGVKLTTIIASWRYYSDHTKFSYVTSDITKLMNVVLKGELVSS